jgi:3-oxoacyl-[acyl-carrier-protein] synthase II
LIVNHATAVWITGVGAATPLGHEYATIADNLLAGRSGVAAITGFDASQHPSQIGGQVLQVPCPPHFEPQEFSRVHRLEQLMLWCSTKALLDAGWWDRRHEVRLGLVLGIGAEWLVYWEADALKGGNLMYREQLATPAMVAATQKRLQVSGPVASVSAACASGNYAIAQARRWLELGWVDVCLAGACDMALSPLSLAGFGNLRALSRRNKEPQAASRPFDKKRDGFVMSEGGTVFVLETEASARRRSARPYGCVAGCGASSDAHNMVMPSPDPGPATAAMRQALADARIEPRGIHYVNAHATSTPVGDQAEARVLEAVFGDHLLAVPVSSTKSMTGHLLTAAAALEALACLVAMEQKAIPPTINLDEPDPECRLCHVANQARSQTVRAAVSNSFGFGGSNTCLVLTAA